MPKPLHDIPEPEGADAKEVYAFYGLAAYCAQVLEKGLVNLATGLHIDGLSITRAQFDTLFNRFDSATFGQLINAARVSIQIPSATETVLAEALAKRNRLMHDFFADNAAAFMTDRGRAQMIVELRDLVDLFQRADREVDELLEPIAIRRGLTEELINQLAAEMVEEFFTASGGKS